MILPEQLFWTFVILWVGCSFIIIGEPKNTTIKSFYNLIDKVDAPLFIGMTVSAIWWVWY